jgi:hypothetical protein
MKASEDVIFEMYQSGDLDEAQIIKIWFPNDTSGASRSRWTIEYSMQERLLLEACYKSDEELIDILLRPTLLDYCSFDTIEKVIEVALDHDLLSVIRFYVEYSICDLSEILYWACKQKFGENVKSEENEELMHIFNLLLKNDTVNAAFDSNLCIGAAAKYGNVYAVRALLECEDVDPSDYHNYAICMACKFGHVEVAELLLKDRRVVPSDDDNRAIRLACKYNQIEIVTLLLDSHLVDPSCRSNVCIQHALDLCNTELVIALLSDSRVSLTNAQAVALLRQITESNAKSVAQGAHDATSTGFHQSSSDAPQTDFAADASGWPRHHFASDSSGNNQSIWDATGWRMFQTEMSG